MFDFILHLGPGETALLFMCLATVTILIGRKLLVEPDSGASLTLTKAELRALVSESVQESTAPLQQRIKELEVRQAEHFSLQEPTNRPPSTRGTVQRRVTAH